MSLEKALERLAEAIEKQTALIEAVGGQTVAAPEKEEKPKKKSKAKKEEPVEDDEAEVEEKPKAKKKSKAKKEKAEDENIHDKKYYKETVQPLTRKSAKTLGKDVVLGILDEFGTGLETAKDLEESQWEEYVERLENELEAHEAEDDSDEDDLS